MRKTLLIALLLVIFAIVVVQAQSESFFSWMYWIFVWKRNEQNKNFFFFCLFFSLFVFNIPKDWKKRIIHSSSYWGMGIWSIFFIQTKNLIKGFFFFLLRISFKIFSLFSFLSSALIAKPQTKGIIFRSNLPNDEIKISFCRKN